MKPINYRIFAFSENTLTLQLDPIISESQIRFLYRLKSTILAKKWPSVYEILVTFHELSIIFDCRSLSFEDLQESVEELIGTAELTVDGDTDQEVNQYAIPVCYDEELALDKDRMENQTGLDYSEIVHLHQQGNYILYMIGFLPGFMYLGGLNKKLHCNRLKIPRQNVSTGSVGIAGEQTGIYPMESPGGWNIVGRTPLTIFDFDTSSRLQSSGTAFDEAVQIRPLDKINFVAISKSQFEELQGMNVMDYQKSIHKSQ